MRYYEIINEAITPAEVVYHLTHKKTGDEAIIIGGRVLTGTNVDMSRTFKKINLKNIKSSKSQPLLFHGTASGSITRFNDCSWFASDPLTSTGHAFFSTFASSNMKKYMYICRAVIKNPLNDSDHFVPGQEDHQRDIVKFYKDHPEYDAMIWHNFRDAWGPNSIIYNIKNGSQVEIVKKWEIRDYEVGNTNWDRVMSGKQIDPKIEDDEDKAELIKGRDTEDHIYIVVDPGLTPFVADQPITQDEYDEYAEYGLAVKKIK